MAPHKQLYTHPLYLKFLKTCRKLQQLLSSGRSVSSRQVEVLTRRRSRYAKQLLSLPAYTLKAAAVAGFSLMLSAQVHAQGCNRFRNADSANPVRRPGLPQNLIQPTFVDIDNDGDLDCYEANANTDDGGGNYLKITFLRNTGTKKVPYFEVDTASGFGKLPKIQVPFNSDESRTTFVDIDGDGDYDCFLSNYNNNRDLILFYKNTGTAAKAKFVSTPSENPLANIHGYYGMQLSFADLDADGDFDMSVSDLYKTDVFENTGTKTKAVFERTFQSYITTFGRTTLYDYDKDGLTDALVSRGPSVFFYKNIGTATNPKFKIDKNRPKFSADFATLFGFADLNNDGFTEAYSTYGDYASTAPVATISAANNGDPGVITLQANPAEAYYGYRWRKDGKIIPGATTFFYQASATGSYTVEITGSCGTGISLPYVLSGNAADADRSSLSVTTAISKTEVLPVVKAYPNPFTDHFTLYIGKNEVANTFIRISDVQGRIISATKANGSVMQLGSNLQKGIYIVQVIQNNAVLLAQKIIKE